MAIAEEVLEKSIIALKSFSNECQIRSACYVFINGKIFFNFGKLDKRKKNIVIEEIYIKFEVVYMLCNC
jgi:hypothetical protein